MNGRLPIVLFLLPTFIPIQSFAAALPYEGVIIKIEHNQVGGTVTIRCREDVGCACKEGQIMRFVVNSKKIGLDQHLESFEKLREGYFAHITADLEKGMEAEVLSALSKTPERFKDKEPVKRLPDCNDQIDLATSVKLKKVSEGGRAGLRILEVERETVWEKVGVRENDLFLRVGNKPVTGSIQLVDWICNQRRPSAYVFRNGSEIQIK